MTESLKNRFAMEADILSLGLMAVVLSSIVLVFTLTAQQVYAAANEPTFRVIATKAQPDIKLNKGQKWHLFLSHIWGTGQDQCANIKRQMLAYVPGVSVFLDVDDLQDIGELETCDRRPLFEHTRQPAPTICRWIEGLTPAFASHVCSALHVRRRENGHRDDLRL